MIISDYFCLLSFFFSSKKVIFSSKKNFSFSILITRSVHFSSTYIRLYGSQDITFILKLVSFVNLNEILFRSFGKLLDNIRCLVKIFSFSFVMFNEHERKQRKEHIKRKRIIISIIFDLAYRTVNAE